MRLIGKSLFRCSIFVSAACVGLAACVAPIQRYEGTPEVRYGTGGAREVVDGVDVWTHGEPPRAYERIGYTSVESPEGWIGNRILLSRIAGRVREAGGDAALLGEARTRLESLHKAGGQMLAENRRIVEITIIRYR